MIVRLFWLFCLWGIVTGCSDKLSLFKVSHGTWHQEEKPWTLEKAPRPPQNIKEERIVKAAETKQTLKLSDHTYGYLGTVDDDKIVVVFDEDRYSPDQFAPKPVEHYLVRSGQLRGFLTTVEALPDVDFEKAVYNAARNAHNESRFAVLLVRTWRQPLTMKASFLGSCSITVDVINGFEPYGAVLCTKLVNFCFNDTE